MNSTRPARGAPDAPLPLPSAKPVIDAHGHLLVPEANALADGHPRESPTAAAERASFSERRSPPTRRRSRRVWPQLTSVDQRLADLGRHRRGHPARRPDADAQRLAGERGRRLRGEERHRARDVAGYQRARQRLPRPDLLERGERHVAAGGRGIGEPGCDAGGRDPVGAVPDRQGPRERDERSLARHVGQHVRGRRRPDRVGDHEDDPAEAACGHAGDERLGEQQRGLHVDRLHPPPGGQVKRGQVGPVERGRRVHEDVTAPVRAEHLRRGLADLVRARQVDRRVGGLVKADGAMPGGGQRRHDRTADRARSAGDHGHPLAGSRVIRELCHDREGNTADAWRYLASPMRMPAGRARYAGHGRQC